jgi:EAL domain-containing protein (putative c-di-GMP-specific phosphodiesterase class I)
MLTPISNRLFQRYQPIVDLNSHTVAVEALVRWRHPLLGLLPPSRFIPVAEESELIERVGEWVFRRVCKEMAQNRFYIVSINISGRQLKRCDFVSKLSTILSETRCRASNFILEITETVMLDAEPETIRTIRELQAMGFLVALDDFGTGNNSFSLLRDIRADIIKIDKSYIQSLGEDVVAQAFVTAISTVSRSRDILLIAEGVETVDQWELAKLAGATRFQGHLFGRPRPFHLMTGAQRSYLKTLSEQAHQPNAYAEDLTKAEASKRIDELRQSLDLG